MPEFCEREGTKPQAGIILPPSGRFYGPIL